MGWGYCGEDQDGRPMGYTVEATCDEESCKTDIDRGLAYVCGGMHEGGEYGCGGYFCYTHLHPLCGDLESDEDIPQLCKRCCESLEKKNDQDD